MLPDVAQSLLNPPGPPFPPGEVPVQSQPQPHPSKCWPGVAGTALLVTTLLILTMLTIGFVFQTSRSLENVRLSNITNIVVAQDELLMDISLEASNPNLLPVTLGDTISL